MELQGRNVHWRQKAQNTGHMSSCLQLQRHIGTFRSIGPGELCTHPRSLTSESETDQQTATLQYSQVSSILTSLVSWGGGICPTTLPRYWHLLAATAAVGTYPTGMHTCFHCAIIQKYLLPSKRCIQRNKKECNVPCHEMKATRKREGKRDQYRLNKHQCFSKITATSDMVSISTIDISPHNMCKCECTGWPLVCVVYFEKSNSRVNGSDKWSNRHCKG